MIIDAVVLKGLNVVVGIALGALIVVVALSILVVIIAPWHTDCCLYPWHSCHRHCHWCTCC
jgi:hypothetical protein